MVPRILSAAEWDALSRGLNQRVKALNLYLRDIYGTASADAGVLPAELVSRTRSSGPK